MILVFRSLAMAGILSSVFGKNIYTLKAPEVGFGGKIGKYDNIKNILSGKIPDAIFTLNPCSVLTPRFVSNQQGDPIAALEQSNSVSVSRLLEQDRGVVV